MSQESSLSELEMAKEYSTVLADTNDENGKPYGYTRPNPQIHTQPRVTQSDMTPARTNQSPHGAIRATPELRRPQSRPAHRPRPPPKRRRPRQCPRQRSPPPREVREVGRVVGRVVVRVVGLGEQLIPLLYRESGCVTKPRVACVAR